MANSGKPLAVVIQFLLGTNGKVSFPLRFNGSRQQQQHNHKLWNIFAQNGGISKVKRIQPNFHVCYILLLQILQVTNYQKR
jgi:hypothetical protein